MFLRVALLFLTSYTLGIRDPNYYVISFERAIQYINLNVILLLMGMMIIVVILEDIGILNGFLLGHLNYPEEA